jgi:hypothetical protein
MAGKSNYLEGVLLNEVLGATNYTAPATVYVALYTAAPTDAGGGTEVTTSGSAYARAAVTNNATNWPAAAGTPRSKSNGTAITYAAPTANWGTVTHFGILDAASAGNLLYWAALTASKVINNGDGAPSFAAGSLSVSED